MRRPRILSKIYAGFERSWKTFTRMLVDGYSFWLVPKPILGPFEQEEETQESIVVLCKSRKEMVQNPFALNGEVTENFDNSLTMQRGTIKPLRFDADGSDNIAPVPRKSPGRLPRILSSIYAGFEDSWKIFAQLVKRWSSLPDHKPVLRFCRPGVEELEKLILPSNWNGFGWDSNSSGQPTVVEGINTGSILVATFINPDANRDPNSGDSGGESLADSGGYYAFGPHYFHAVIDWGDNSNQDVGIVSFNSATGFEVRGSHTYSGVGEYPLSVYVTDQGNPQALINDDLPVLDWNSGNSADWTGGSGGQSSIGAGIYSGSVLLNSFANPDGSGTSGGPATGESGGTYGFGDHRFKAMIDWGDGSAQDSGNIRYNSDIGQFQVFGAHTYASTGTYTITIVVTEDDNDLTPVTDTMTAVDPGSAISISMPGDQYNAPGAAVSWNVSASDADGDNIVGFSLSGQPNGITIDNQGHIWGTLDAGAAQTNNGIYSVTLTATDSSGDAFSAMFTWYVNSPPPPGGGGNNGGSQDPVPTLFCPITMYGTAGAYSSLYLGFIPATDGDTLSFTLVGDFPNWLSIDPYGHISGTIASNAAVIQGGSYTVTVKATDSGGAEVTTSFIWLVFSNNAAITLVNPGDQTNAEGDSPTIYVGASGDAANTVTHFTIEGQPLGLTIDDSGYISGTIDYNAAETHGGVYTAIVSAKNDAGTLVAGTAFSWTVTNPPPLFITVPTTLTLNHGVTFTPLDVSATPGSDGAAVTNYTLTGQPSALEINPTTGVISETAAPAVAGVYTNVIETATSTSGGTASQGLIIIVTSGNAGPAITSPNPATTQTFTEGQDVSMPIITTPAANGDAAINFQMSGQPSGIEIDPQTGEITGSPDYGSGQTTDYHVKVTATDNTGGQTTVQLNWHVNQAPIVLDNPGAQTNEAGSSVYIPIYGNDPDGYTLTFSETGLPDRLSINTSNGEITGTLADNSASVTPYAVTVKADDGHGDTMTTTFNMTVAPKESLIDLNNPGNQTNKPGDFVDVLVTASDSNGDTLTFTATGLPDRLRINTSNGEITGTLADDSGSTIPYTVSVKADDGHGDTMTTTFQMNVTPIPDAVTFYSLQQGAAAGRLTSFDLATMTDANPAATAANFSSATIDWGDGTPNNHDVSPITIGTKDLGGMFQLPASHTYAADGTYTAIITVTTIGGAPVSTTSTVVVGDRVAGDADPNNTAWSVITVPAHVAVTAYKIPADPPNDIVASFVVANGNQGTPGDFKAVITFDDNLTEDATIDSANGKYYVHALPDPNIAVLHKFIVTVSQAGENGKIPTANAGAVQDQIGVQIKIAINNTEIHNDDIYQIGTPVLIILLIYAPEGDSSSHIVNLTLAGPAATLDNYGFVIEGSGFHQVWLTQSAVSQIIDDEVITATVDGEQVAQQEGTGINVAWGNNGDVRNSDTPANMLDRIPPRVATPFSATYAGPDITSKNVWFSIGNSGAGADGKNRGRPVFKNPSDKTFPIGFQITTAKKYDLTLLGSPPDEPNQWTQNGVGAQLVLRVWQYANAQDLKGSPVTGVTETKSFAVTPIPIKAVVKNMATLKGENVPLDKLTFAWGAEYSFGFTSDSGDDNDLRDHILIAEDISDTTATGTQGQGTLHQGNGVFAPYEAFANGIAKDINGLRSGGPGILGINGAYSALKKKMDQGLVPLPVLYQTFRFIDSVFYTYDPDPNKNAANFQNNMTNSYTIAASAYKITMTLDPINQETPEDQRYVLHVKRVATNDLKKTRGATPGIIDDAFQKQVDIPIFNK